MKCPIPSQVIERADLLIAAALQAELLQQMAGVPQSLQTPAAVGTLLRSMRSAAKLKKCKKGGAV